MEAFYFGLYRLLDDGICSEANVPSISSINRIIRDKTLVERRGYDAVSGSTKDEVNYTSNFAVAQTVC
jgi:'Paired box' domain